MMINMKEKVFCEDCEHYLDEVSPNWGIEAGCLFVKGTNNTPYRKGVEVFAASEKDNKYNKCKFFKKKGISFWKKLLKKS